MIDLKARFGSTYRITLDPSASIPGQTREDRLWNYRIPCKYGHIYVHGKEMLGAYCTGKIVGKRLLAIPGVKIHQQGDKEVTATFPPDALGQVADLMRAKRKAVLSQERREWLRAHALRIQKKRAFLTPRTPLLEVA